MLRTKVINILRNPSTIEPLIEQAILANDFFTRSSISYAIDAIVEKLPHAEPRNGKSPKRKVGVICAGNIPLVGLGDMYNALLMGDDLYLKPSRRDPLMRAFAPLCSIVDELPQDVELILAMGSDQTMRALGQQYPHAVLRAMGTEHSAGVLSGSESDDELRALVDDIFTHSSLGCRSVTHLHLPRGYDLQKLVFERGDREFRTAWFNNYHQQRALSVMRGESFVDGGYYILKEGFAQAIATVGYTLYDSIDTIQYGQGKIKSIVASSHLAQSLPCRTTKFGFAQRPDFEICEF